MVERREPIVESALPCREQFDADGFTIARALLAASEVRQARDALIPLLETGRAGVRNLLRQSTVVASVARSERILHLLRELVDVVPFAVRGILFDKTPEANWRVAWHQDLTIAVHERAEVPGFGPWSIKEGVIHTQAPASVLEQMLTVRIHLDDANETNGALQLIPGSHRSGKLDDATISDAVAACTGVTCAAQAGDVLVMRPLLLHASCPGTAPSHRRVIHIEYAAHELPAPLHWFERAG